MSLQYVIDAYNLINHPRFSPQKPLDNIQSCLADFVKFNKLSGSKNNEVILVFDGYPKTGQIIPQERGLTCLFSQAKEADEVIKNLIENSVQPKDIVVVTDDKEVRIISRLLHAQVSSVEEFICGKEKKLDAHAKDLDSDDPKLSYSAMQKIDAELKEKWL